MKRPAPSASAWIILLGGRSQHTEEPAVASVAHLAPIHLGLDVHRDTIDLTP